MHLSAAVTAVRTGIAGLQDALLSASVMVTAAIICANAAAADPSQQEDQFVGLLQQEQIPALDKKTCLVSSPEPIKFVANWMAAPRSTPW